MASPLSCSLFPASLPAVLLTAASLVTTAAPAPTASAHETDQFLMPVDAAETEFADLGRYFSDYFGDTVRRAIEELNTKIDRAERRAAEARPHRVRVSGNRVRRRVAAMIDHEPDPDRYRTPYAIANAVRDELPHALALIDGLEWNPPDATRYGYDDDDLVIYKPHSENAMHTELHFVLDPRILGRLWRAGTFQAYDAYMGADKIGHFVDMGFRYYKVYDRKLNAGRSHDEATAAAVEYGSVGGLLSEQMLLGRATAGAYSNADLASNLAGMFFYLNLTEPVPGPDGPQAPLAYLGEDGRWYPSTRLLDDPDFFAGFLTDHFNEALNPSHFERGMRKKVREAIRERWDRVVQWYPQSDAEPEWFTEKAERLSTLHGVPYGHSGRWDQLYHLGNTVPPQTQTASLE